MPLATTAGITDMTSAAQGQHCVNTCTTHFTYVAARTIGWSPKLPFLNSTTTILALTPSSYTPERNRPSPLCS